MTDLVWYDFLEIGVDFIDNDHKRLLAIMQETKAAIDVGDFDKCARLLSTLLSEAKAHFQREEAYLAEIEYPDLEKHTLYHDELLTMAKGTKRICEGIETEHDLQECFDGMVNFLIDDILKGDVRFKSFLEYHGHIKPDIREIP